MIICNAPVTLWSSKLTNLTFNITLDVNTTNLLLYNSSTKLQIPHGRLHYIEFSSTVSLFLQNGQNGFWEIVNVVRFLATKVVTAIARIRLMVRNGTHVFISTYGLRNAVAVHTVNKLGIVKNQFEVGTGLFCAHHNAIIDTPSTRINKWVVAAGDPLEMSPIIKLNNADLNPCTN